MRHLNGSRTNDSPLAPQFEPSTAIKGLPMTRSQILPPPSSQVLQEALHLSSLTIEWLAGDGSDRCYYRLRSSNLKDPLVLMQLSGSDADALKANGYDWVKIAGELADAGVYVPEVVATLPDHAALIIEDYGDHMLEGEVRSHIASGAKTLINNRYEVMFELIAKLLGLPSQGKCWASRSFDTERFAWELRFFQQQYVDPQAGLNFTSAELQQLIKDQQALAQFLSSYSRYFTHRDLHSRNIMVKADDLALIDFQDARLGPPSYDLVSLCFDSYVNFTGSLRRQFLRQGIATVARLLDPKVAQEIEKTWRPMLVQRQLKAIGSFAYLTNEKKRGDYLKYVGPALKALYEQGVYDERWSFLSGELLERVLVAHQANEGL